MIEVTGATRHQLVNPAAIIRVDEAPVSSRFHCVLHLNDGTVIESYDSYETIKKLISEARTHE